MKICRVLHHPIDSPTFRFMTSGLWIVLTFFRLRLSLRVMVPLVLVLMLIVKDLHIKRMRVVGLILKETGI